MIKYQDWLQQCINARVEPYREIGKRTNVTFQQVNHIFLGKKMPSLESGTSIDNYFGNKIRFEDYVMQFAWLLEGYSDEFLAEYLGVHKLTVKNILEWKHVARIETYEKLEELLEMEENNA